MASLDPAASLDPVDWDATRADGHHMLDELFDHLQGLRDQAAWRPVPDEVRRRHRSDLPIAPGSLTEAHDTFKTDMLAYAGGNLHPGFMGWVQGAGTPVGVLAEMLAAGLNGNLGGRDHMPIAIEQEVVGWMRSLFGFPEGSTGLMVTGASMANFIGVLVARRRALGPEGRRSGVAGPRLTAYASTATHGCVSRGMDMAGLGSLNLRQVATDSDHRIDLDALKAVIAADRAAGLLPFLLVANAGTVDAGAIDDIDALADLAETEGLHLHVDGAYGALGMLTPEIAPRLAGIERADSLAFDFHKWAHVPYDAGFVLVRDGDLHRETFATSAAYLSRETRGLAGGDFWPCDYGPDLSRGFKALKVWFTFKVLGADAIARAIEYSCALARELQARIEAEPELELLAPAQLSIVCFRYRALAADADAVNRAIVADLHEAGAAAPSLTAIDGKAAIRAALFNHRTEHRDLDALIKGVLAAGRVRTAPDTTQEAAA